MAPIGFVILTHSPPPQVTRLIHCLNAVYQDPPIVLHHDFSQCPAEFSLPSNVKIVDPHIVTGWAQFSIVRATLAGIETLFSGSDIPDWFAVLSGACYPTKPAEDALSDLENDGYDAYLHHELIDPLMPRRPFHAVCIWRYFNWSVPFPGDNFAPGYRNFRTPEVLASQSSVYQNGFACYAGSQWFTARNSVADYILGWSKENPWLEEHLSHRPFPDETYIHSIVCNAKQFRVSQNNYRYIEWSETDSHPKTLDLEDLPKILKSGAHFARKFAPGSEVLDALDQQLHRAPGRKLQAEDTASDDSMRAPLAVQGLIERSPSAESAAHKTISVIIATFQRTLSLERTLQSLEAQTDKNFEAIVVCDGEDPETMKFSQSYLASYPLKWLFKDKEYLPAARNAGARIAAGDILLFLDDDATAGPDWIKIHRAHHMAEGNNRPILVIGRTVHVYDKPASSHTERLLREQRDARDAQFSAVLENPDAHSAEKLQCHSVCGFNCSIDRSIFWKVGGFDPNMRPVFEEFELGERLHSAGVETVIAPDAVLRHHDTKNLVQDALSYSRNWTRLAVYRVTEKGQRNAQLSGLRTLRTANPAKRLHHALSWYAPGPVNACAGLTRTVCDRTGSRWFFRQWQRLQGAADGFQALRTEGLTLAAVRKLVGNPLLVLAAHCISPSLNETEKRYHITSEKFRALLKRLDANNYRSVSIDEGLCTTSGKSYLLTFDDGFEELYAELLSLLESYKIRPLVFVVVDRLGSFNEWEAPVGYTRRKLLSIEQIREMARYGVQFGSHTCTHPWLPTLTEADLWREVNDSKRRLEDLLGSEVTSFAYPYGGANAHVRATVARAGYKWAFSTSPGLSFWDDRMWIRRVEVGENDSTLDLLLKLSTGKSMSQRLAGRFTGLRRFAKSVLKPRQTV